ncbi:Mg2+ transporter MgtE [Owenweeksia hongkongensis DSM 17368]|uniref:Magnesium transporter MgtE n=1 Tax=Owenweeksia hongkongensis (strain DSM 17368 / CIP 108786 / JCM 12287 / NRRL B-23963 / UST20020801) TaxID=926562 RepID=G8R5X6_OWEHD|nr:magnesium transporter [Owenweeksia hongkongensis]AEV31124.1 Mg2+ transporter MgtE [Owenweeksia hongkongensis DSM 17368]
MKFEVTSEYINQLEEDVIAGNAELHLEELNDTHAADIAEVVDQMSLEAGKLLLHDLEDEKAADVLIELDEDLRAKILEDYSGLEIATELVDNLDSDDAADLINELSEERQREVLNSIEDPIQAKGLADLLIYPENTAGALMGTELVKVNHNWRVLQCVKEMRRQAEDIEHVHSVYVVDDANKLLGTLSLKKLLTTSTKTPIGEVFTKNAQSVEAMDDAEDVARAMEKYDLIVMPVVDSLNHLIGRITIDDVVDVIRDEAKEDYNFASGLVEDVESDDSVWTTTRARLPWLLIGLVGGLGAASVIGRFELELSHVPKMAFFIPLIAAMGGNVGVQSSAIIVQALASKSPMGSLLKRLFKELGVGLLNGLICSLIIVGASLFLGYETKLAITVAVALISVVVVAALIGTFVPLLLDKYKIDPALATGPFITTTNDILGLFIYFTIGSLLLGA